MTTTSTTPPPPLPTQTTEQLTSTDHSFDPHYGRHWNSSLSQLSFDSLHTRHNTHSQVKDGIPASLTTIFDLQQTAIDSNAVVLSTNGKCPSSTSAYKCCPAPLPQEIWGNPRNPVVAICTGVTTRGIKDEDLHPGHLALFQRLMPTIISTYDCDIDYILTFGFDKGDNFYDTQDGQAEIESWLTKNKLTQLMLLI